jgi:hypothetical protein
VQAAAVVTGAGELQQCYIDQFSEARLFGDPLMVKILWNERNGRIKEDA